MEEREFDEYEYEERKKEQGTIILILLLVLTAVVAVVYLFSEKEESYIPKDAESYTESNEAPSSLPNEAPSSLSSEVAIPDESIQLVASALERVVVGMPFEVTFSLKNYEADTFQAGNWDEAFNVSSQPRVQRGSGTSMQNGQLTKFTTTNYVYDVVPKKEGTFTIAPAKATVNGKEYVSNALAVSVFSGGQSNDKKFVAAVLDKVFVGKQIRVTFSLDSPDADNFQVPDWSDAFEILMGPSVSRQKTVTSIKGQPVVMGSTTYTYILKPKVAGTFTISPAKVMADGKLYESNPLTIPVLP